MTIFVLVLIGIVPLNTIPDPFPDDLGCGRWVFGLSNGLDSVFLQARSIAGTMGQVVCAHFSAKGLFAAFGRSVLVPVK